MVLNIMPRRSATETVAPVESEFELPTPSAEALDEERKPRRRGTRGGRGRKRADGSTPTTEQNGTGPAEDIAVAEEPVVAEEPPAPAPRARRGSRSAAAKAEAAASDEQSPEPPAEAPAAPRKRASRTAAAAEPAAAGVSTDGAGIAALTKAIEQQGRQLEQLVRLAEDAARRPSGGGGTVAVGAPPARVGVFVDAANIELACDRLRARFDWRKVLDLLCRDRRLIRAIAYSPVHDDPGVSIETQRFVEPFLDRGFKVVTKPLRRFHDGSIKANVDIEMALDVISMVDRLDVVCLVSGDGDFQRLVEVLQERGVRVEVVAVGSSTASNLKRAADEFIDLGARVREIRA